MNVERVVEPVFLKSHDFREVPTSYELHIEDLFDRCLEFQKGAIVSAFGETFVATVPAST